MTGITVMPTGRSQTLPLTMSGLRRMSGRVRMLTGFEFFCDTVQEKDRDGIFLTDGTILEGKALHPVAMTAVNAQAALASDQKMHFSVSTVSGRHRFAPGTEDIMTTVCISSHIWH